MPGKTKTKKRSASNHQVATKGKLSRAKDRKVKAKPPGYRKSASGNWYSERRINRSDKSRRARL